MTGELFDVEKQYVLRRRGVIGEPEVVSEGGREGGREGRREGGRVFHVVSLDKDDDGRVGITRRNSTCCDGVE